MSIKRDTKQIPARLRGIFAQERRKVVVRSRLWHGFKRLFQQPWTLAFPLLLAIAAVLAWHNTDKLPLPGGNEAIPEMVILWQLVLRALVVVLTVLAFLLLLALLGTPCRAKKIDNALSHAGLVDRYGLAPALLYVQPVKDTAAIRKVIFYSKGVPLTRWVEQEGDISDALNVHFVEPPAYGGKKGNNRNYIVLTVAPGAGNQPTPVLYDDGL